MDTTTILKERFPYLPKSVQELLLSSRPRQVAEDMALRHALSEEQEESLETEMLLVLMGLESMDDFQTNIWRELHLDQEKAHYVSRDLETIIFKSVSEDLKKLLDEEEKSSEERPVSEKGEDGAEISDEQGDGGVQDDASQKKGGVLAAHVAGQAHIAKSEHVKKEGEEVKALENTRTVSYPDGADPYHEPFE